MELILIRNGETDLNLKNVCLGATDAELNAKGLRQVQTAARIFHNSDITAIYTSPQKRAVKSADCLNKYHNLPVEILPELSERDFGHWENKSFAEIKEEFKEEYDAWLSDWVEYEIPMGESAKEANKRNVAAIKQIISENPNGSVLVVADSGAIANIMAHFLEMELSGAWHFKVNNGAVTRFLIDEDGYATLTSFNEI